MNDLNKFRPIDPKLNEIDESIPKYESELYNEYVGKITSYDGLYGEIQVGNETYSFPATAIETPVKEGDTVSFRVQDLNDLLATDIRQYKNDDDMSAIIDQYITHKH